LLFGSKEKILNSKVNNRFNYRAVIWGCAVGTVTKLRAAQLTKHRSFPSEQEDIFFSSKHPDRL
jgi:hypothetical protein